MLYNITLLIRAYPKAQLIFLFLIAVAAFVTVSVVQSPNYPAQY